MPSTIFSWIAIWLQTLIRLVTAVLLFAGEPLLCLLALRSVSERCSARLARRTLKVPLAFQAPPPTCRCGCCSRRAAVTAARSGGGRRSSPS